MGQNTHYFIALSLPLEAKEILNNHSDRLKTHFPFSRWVHREDYHITLAFLGNAPEEQLNTAAALIRDKIADSHCFPVDIHEIGTFGNPHSPRIFWAGPKNQPKLFQLQEQVFDACLHARFQLETRPFNPHITLARKWNGEQPFLREWLRERNPFASKVLSFLAREVILYQTMIGKSPKYRAVATFPLIAG